ncbi:3'-5' exonuclease [Aquifex pyrophilus]
MRLLNFLKKKLLLKRAKNSPYFKDFYENVDLNKKVYETTFVVFDCEATDLNVKKAELLSIGALKVINLSLDISTLFYELVKTNEIKAAEIHGITREDIEKMGKEPKEVIKDFLTYIKGCVLVGFYVKYDAALVEKYSRLYFNYPLINYKLDVLSLYTRGYYGGKSLDDIAREYGIELKGRHNALDDAYITALLFLKLIYPYRNERLKDLPLFI